ncbi:MAG: hypothetical protein H6667_14080 [Ardenticatenaceae bacterium]|nr:hypothetical protein [Ardenticatenaceae bacterium]MCB9444186.1 hypothetical protein [Ardenticatenaceae bacterium]
MLTDTVEVVVSLQTVERGWQMTAAELVTDTRYIDEVSDNVITNIEDAIGLYARTKIFQGETLTKDALVADPSLIGQTEYGPSSLIPPGYIAMAVPMDRLSGVAYALNEGDYIDIMMTFLFYQIDEQFQTYLQNAAVFYLEDAITTGGEAPADGGTPTPQQTNIFVMWPYGRFEQLPTGDTVHIYGSEYQRPVPISMILQNARVIQVGNYAPPEPIEPATPTPEPVAEGEATPTPQPGGPIPPTPTPYPSVLLVALTPQQQLFLKYAVESNANIDFALRGANDNQLYTVQNVDINLLLERFNIEIPPNFNYSVDSLTTDVTPTPEAQAADTAPSGPENE